MTRTLGFSRIEFTVLSGVALLAAACEGNIEDVSAPTGSGAGAAAISQGGGGPVGIAGGPSAAGASVGPSGSGGAAASNGGTQSGNAGAAGATNPGGGAAGMPNCTAPSAAPAHVRLLTPSQVDHALDDLFQVTGAFASDPQNGFGNTANAVFKTLDVTEVKARADVAARAAQQAAAGLAKWSPCTPPAGGDASACEQQIIDKIGERAYRRPLGSDERAQMKALFDAGIKEKDFVTGVEWFLAGVLQSPDFLYQIVKPVPGEIPGQVQPLGAHEYASRLAFFLWDGPPDDALIAGAEELLDPSMREAQLTRIMADPKFKRGVERFYGHWFHIEAFDTVARNAAGFDFSVVQALSTSLMMSATELYAGPSPNISSLLSGETFYMNDVLRKFYGVSGSSTGFTLTALPGQKRHGVLTHPGLMAALARPGQSFPISRGLFVLRKLFCIEVPLPPQGLEIPLLEPVKDGLSSRAQLEAHTENQICAGCHNLIDPPGFALENFDEVGRYRTMDHGVAVDSSGTIEVESDIDGAFASGEELLAKLATSVDVRSCFASHYLNFALSRTETEAGDKCSATQLGRTFAASGDLKQLAQAVAQSDSFTLRQAEGVVQ
jgi:hypothetical protein